VNCANTKICTSGFQSAPYRVVSSEGLLVLAKLKLFGTEQGLAELLQEALWLHLGTFLAALVYFRKDISTLLKALCNRRTTSQENRNTPKFLIIATLISGLMSWTFFILISDLEDRLAVTGKILTLALGILLLVTGILQIRAKDHGLKTRQNLTTADGILLGFVQGLAALPGLSRSGFTPIRQSRSFKTQLPDGPADRPRRQHRAQLALDPPHLGTTHRHYNLLPLRPSDHPRSLETGPPPQLRLLRSPLRFANDCLWYNLASLVS